jgi:hypothetical protein
MLTTISIFAVKKKDNEQASRRKTGVMKLISFLAANLAFTIFLSLGSNGFQKSAEAGVAFGRILEKASLITIVPRAEKCQDTSHSDIR